MLVGAIAWSALLMGLMGGSHCLAMCAAPCGSLVASRRESPLLPVDRRGIPIAHLNARAWVFHAGRLLGYGLLGGLAALAMESLAWLTQSMWSLRPLWTFAHVGMLAWSVILILQARQPSWVERAGRRVWDVVRPLVQRPGGVFVVGSLWALMPCGLLYSALLVSALTADAVQGALSMFCFAVGSGVWLWMGPWLWRTVKIRLNGWRADWGTRFAGLMLLCLATWALWIDLVYKPSLWCR